MGIEVRKKEGGRRGSGWFRTIEPKSKPFRLKVYRLQEVSSNSEKYEHFVVWFKERLPFSRNIMSPSTLQYNASLKREIEFPMAFHS